MTTRAVQNKSNSGVRLFRKSEILNFPEYLEKVLQLVIVEPINSWLGGSLAYMNLKGLLEQIESAQANGVLLIEYYVPKSGETARGLMLVNGGVVRTAILRTTSVANDLFGMVAVRKVVERMMTEKTGKKVAGSFFFQTCDMPTVSPVMTKGIIDLRSCDLPGLTEDILRE